MSVELKMLLKSSGANFSGIDTEEVARVAVEMLISGEEFNLAGLPNLLAGKILEQVTQMPLDGKEADSIDDRDLSWLRSYDMGVLRAGMGIAKNEQERDRVIQIFDERKKSLMAQLNQSEFMVGSLMKALQNLYGFSSDKVVRMDTGQIEVDPKAIK